MINPAKSESILVGSIPLEADYAGFARGSVINNETTKPGLGFTVRYHSSLGEATIYIYNKNIAEIPDGPMSEVVLNEFNLAIREVLLLGESKREEVNLIDRYGTGSPHRGREFLCAEFVITDPSGPRQSFLYITGVAGHFLKIRITLQPNHERNLTAREFADAVAGQLWSTAWH